MPCGPRDGERHDRDGNAHLAGPDGPAGPLRWRHLRRVAPVGSPAARVGGRQHSFGDAVVGRVRALGRCVLSRAIYGARVALTVAVVAALGSMLLGSTLAMLGGYFGGVVDRGISYVVDLWMSFPPVVLSLILLVGLGTGVDKVILAVVLVDWTRFCRVIR